MAKNNSRKIVMLGLFFIVLVTLSFFVSCRRETVFFLFWSSDSKTNQPEKQPQQPPLPPSPPPTKPSEEKELVDSLKGLDPCTEFSDCVDPLTSLQNRKDAVFLSKTTDGKTLCIINKDNINLESIIPIILVEMISENPQRIQLSVPNTLIIGDQEKNIPDEVKQKSFDLINKINVEDLICVKEEKFLTDMYEIFVKLNNLVFLKKKDKSEDIQLNDGKYNVYLSYNKNDQKFVDFFLTYVNLKEKVKIINENDNELNSFVNAINTGLDELKHKNFEEYVIIDKEFIKNKKDVSDFSPIFGLYYLSLNDVSNSINDENFRQKNKAFFLKVGNAEMKYYFENNNNRFVDFLFFANLSYVSHDNKLLNEKKVEELMNFLGYTRARNLTNFEFINDTLNKWKTEKINPNLSLVPEEKNFEIYKNFLADLSNRLPISENLSINKYKLFDFTYFYNLSDYSQKGIYENYQYLNNELGKLRELSCSDSKKEICNLIKNHLINNQKVNYSSVIVTLKELYKKTEDIKYLLGGVLALYLFKPDFCTFSSSDIIVDMDNITKDLSVNNYEDVKNYLNNFFRNENCTYYVLSYSLLLERMQIKGDVLYYLEIVPGLAINKLVFENESNITCDDIFSKGVISKNISLCFNDTPKLYLENKINLTHGKKNVLIEINFSEDSLVVKQNDYFANYSSATNCLYLESNLSFEYVEKLDNIEFKIEFFNKSKEGMKKNLSLKYSIVNNCSCESNKLISIYSLFSTRTLVAGEFNDSINLTFKYDSIINKNYLRSFSYYIDNILIFNSSININNNWETTNSKCEKVEILTENNDLKINVTNININGKGLKDNQNSNLTLNISVPNILSCELSLNLKLEKVYSSESSEGEPKETSSKEEKKDCNQLTLNEVLVLSKVNAYYQDKKWRYNQSINISFSEKIDSECINLINLSLSGIHLTTFELDSSQILTFKDGIKPSSQEIKEGLILLNYSNLEISDSDSFYDLGVKEKNVTLKVEVIIKNSKDTKYKEKNFTIIKEDSERYKHMVEECNNRITHMNVIVLTPIFANYNDEDRTWRANQTINLTFNKSVEECKLLIKNITIKNNLFGVVYVFNISEDGKFNKIYVSPEQNIIPEFTTDKKTIILNWTEFNVTKTFDSKFNDITISKTNAFIDFEVYNISGNLVSKYSKSFEIIKNQLALEKQKIEQCKNFKFYSIDLIKFKEFAIKNEKNQWIYEIGFNISFDKTNYEICKNYIQNITIKNRYNNTEELEYVFNITSDNTLNEIFLRTSQKKPTSKFSQSDNKIIIELDWSNNFLLPTELIKDFNNEFESGLVDYNFSLFLFDILVDSKNITIQIKKENSLSGSSISSEDCNNIYLEIEKEDPVIATIESGVWKTNQTFNLSFLNFITSCKHYIRNISFMSLNDSNKGVVYAFDMDGRVIVDNLKNQNALDFYNSEKLLIKVIWNNFELPSQILESFKDIKINKEKAFYNVLIYDTNNNLINSKEVSFEIIKDNNQYEKQKKEVCNEIINSLKFSVDKDTVDAKLLTGNWIISNQIFNLTFNGDLRVCKDYIKNINLSSLRSGGLVVYAFKINSSNEIENVSKVSDGKMNPGIDFKNGQTIITLNWSEFQVPTEINTRFNQQILLDQETAIYNILIYNKDDQLLKEASVSFKVKKEDVSYYSYLFSICEERIKSLEFNVNKKEVSAKYDNNNWRISQEFFLKFKGNLTECRDIVKEISLISVNSSNLEVYKFNLTKIIKDVNLDGTMANPLENIKYENGYTKIPLKWDNYIVPKDVSSSFNNGELSVKDVKYKINISYYTPQKNIEIWSKETDFKILKSCGIKITKYPKEVYAGDNIEIEFEYLSLDQNPRVKLLENNKEINSENIDIINKKVNHSQSTPGKYDYKLKIICNKYTDESQSINIIVKPSCKCLDVSKFTPLNFGSNQYSVNIPLTNEKNVPDLIKLKIHEIINIPKNAIIEKNPTIEKLKNEINCKKLTVQEDIFIDFKISCYYDDKEFTFNITFLEDLMRKGKDGSNILNIYFINYIPYSLSYRCECNNKATNEGVLELWNSDYNVSKEYDKIKVLKDNMNEIINNKFSIITKSEDLSNKFIKIKLDDTKFNFTILKESKYSATKDLDKKDSREYSVRYYLCFRKEEIKKQSSLYLYFCLGDPVSLNMNRITNDQDKLGNYIYRWTENIYHNLGKSNDNKFVKIDTKIDTKSIVTLVSSIFEILAEGQSNKKYNFMPLLTFIDVSNYNKNDLNEILSNSRLESNYRSFASISFDGICSSVENLFDSNSGMKYTFSAFASLITKSDNTCTFAFYELLDLINPLSQYSFVISGFEVLAKDSQYVRRGVAVVYPSDKDINFGKLTSTSVTVSNDDCKNLIKNSKFTVEKNKVEAIYDNNAKWWRTSQTFYLTFSDNISKCKDQIQSMNLTNMLSGNVVYSFNFKNDPNNPIEGILSFKDDGNMTPQISSDGKKITLEWKNFKVPTNVNYEFNSISSDNKEIKVGYFLNITLSNKESIIKDVDFNITKNQQNKQQNPTQTSKKCTCIDTSKLPQSQEYIPSSEISFLFTLAKEAKAPQKISINLTIIKLGTDRSPTKEESFLIDCGTVNALSKKIGTLFVTCSYDLNNNILNLSFSNVKKSYFSITRYDVAIIPISATINCSCDEKSELIQVNLFNRNSRIFEDYLFIIDNVYKIINNILAKEPKQFSPHSSNILKKEDDLSGYFLSFKVSRDRKMALSIFNIQELRFSNNEIKELFRYYDFCVRDSIDINTYFCFDSLRIIIPRYSPEEKLIFSNNMYYDNKLQVPKEYLFHYSFKIPKNNLVEIDRGVYPFFQIARNLNFLPAVSIFNIISNEDSNKKINIDNLLNSYLGTPNNKYTMCNNFCLDPSFFTSLKNFFIMSSGNYPGFNISAIYFHNNYKEKNSNIVIVKMIEIFTLTQPLPQYYFVVSNYESVDPRNAYSRRGILILYPQEKVNMITVNAIT